MSFDFCAKRAIEKILNNLDILLEPTLAPVPTTSSIQPTQARLQVECYKGNYYRELKHKFIIDQNRSGGAIAALYVSDGVNPPRLLTMDEKNIARGLGLSLDSDAEATTWMNHLEGYNLPSA